MNSNGLCITAKRTNFVFRLKGEFACEPQTISHGLNGSLSLSLSLSFFLSLSLCLHLSICLSIYGSLSTSFLSDSLWYSKYSFTCLRYSVLIVQGFILVFNHQDILYKFIRICTLNLSLHASVLIKIGRRFWCAFFKGISGARHRSRRTVRRIVLLPAKGRGSRGVG